jgi:hypothetical protein
MRFQKMAVRSTQIMRGKFKAIMAPKLMRNLFRKETHLQEIIRLCKEFQFNEQITAEMIWNTGYSLGRDRWWWGPPQRYELREWLRARFSPKRKLIILETPKESHV